MRSASGAYAASFFAARDFLSEKWEIPRSILSFNQQSQRSSSLEIDSKKFGELMSMGDPRTVKHLQQLQMPHANAWLSAVPSYVDGKDFVLRPKIFQTAVKRLLSIPVYQRGTTCTFCKQPQDTYGDHSLCCKKSGDTITRHNRIRNLVAKFAEEGLLSPALEKAGILGHVDASRRPGDVTIENWSTLWL